MFNYDFSLTEDNNSTIPENMTFETEERLSTFKICSDDIVKFIRTLILNKAHGHDDMSFRTKKTCFSDFKPQAILFRNCFENECLPKQREKVKVVPVHEKNHEELIKNYRTVS